ncbi:MAG: MFS transporter [Desulfatiglans sp.]|nr:MFS transporter [Desulfatiglans sp.]
MAERIHSIDNNHHPLKGSLRGIKAVTGAVFLSTLGVAVFTFSFPLLAREHIIAGAWLGAAFSGYFFAKLILAPFAGILSDKTGPKPLLVASTFLGALFPLAYFIFQGQVTLYIIQFGLGLVGGVIKPVGMAVIGAESSSIARGRVFGWYNVFFNAAFMSGPLLGGFLFYQRDFTPVILFLSFSMAISFLIITLFLPTPTRSQRVVRGGRTSEFLQAESGFFHLLIAIAGRTLGIAVVIAYYPVLLSESLFNSSLVFGVLFSIPAITTCLILPLTGWLADRFDKTRLVLVGMLICAVSLLFIGTIQSIPGFIAIGLFLGLGSGISIPASMSLASGAGNSQGKIMGIFHGAANIGFVIGPLFGAIAVRQTMEIHSAFYVAGILGIAACIPLGLSLVRAFLHLKTRYQNFISVGAVCLTICLVTVLLLGPLKAGAKETYRFADLAMGTIIRLTLIAPEEDIADRAASKAFATIHRLEKDLGHRHASGSIGRVNLSAGVAPVEVTQTAYNLLERAVDICKKTEGVFDISIGAVTVKEDYYSQDSPEEKKRLVDYRLVQLNKEDRTVFLPQKGMALDLGGLAKGTIIDLAAGALKSEGIRKGIVEAGGDLYCFGNRIWKVGIQHPRQEGLIGSISLTDRAVCGSGDYYQYVMIEEGGGQERKHHILDPEKLRSAKESIGVTVISPTTEMADALATTLLIMGPEPGKRLLKNEFPDSSALWILPDLTIVKSDNFPPFTGISKE